jgi:hypothetical protein
VGPYWADRSTGSNDNTRPRIGTGNGAVGRGPSASSGACLHAAGAEIRLHGFHGSLANVDVSGDPNIGHISIDKSPRLHARAISEVLAVVKGHRMAAPSGPKPAAANPPIAPNGSDVAKPDETQAPPMKSSNGATDSTSGMNPPGESAPSSRSGKNATRPKAVHPGELPN